jgi:Fe2+ or Zn2+ uptake regulation protein
MPVKPDVVALLRNHGIHPSPQRVVVAEYVLFTTDHPSADEVWEKVKRAQPTLSRATVYNTLNLFSKKGLVRQHVLTEGRTVFDPKIERHHHFVDDATGEILDIPWDALSVGDVERLRGVDVREFQVVLRGRRMGR